MPAIHIPLAAVITLSAQTVTEITVQAGKPVADVQPTMWGVFFEDINFAAEVVPLDELDPYIQDALDLIEFANGDNLNSIGTPNYYVQKLFSNYKGTQVIPVLASGKSIAGQDSLYASGTIDKNAGKVYLKLVN